MLIPRRSFCSIAEAAARCSISPFELIGLAVDGLLEISIAAPPVKTESGEALCGLVDVEAACLLPLFRIEAPASASVPIRRVKTKESGVQWISEPAAGVPIMVADVFVRRSEIDRFEKRFSEPNAIRRNPGGAPPQYDWDGFTGALARWIHDNGIPERQSDLVRAMQDWFDTKGSRSPDASTIRKKVAKAWRELQA